MGKLTDKLLKNVKKRGLGDSLSSSEFGSIDYFLSLGTVTMNLLTSGRWNGGVACSKLTMFAGEKGSTKTLNMQEAIKSMQQEYPDSVVIYVDSEHAVEKHDLENYGVDLERVIYIPLSRIDDDDKELSLMYQLSNIANDIEKDDKVMICIDSVGVLTTGRTNANAEKGNTAKDMSINSEKKKFINMLLEMAGMKKIPIVLINHVYSAIGGFGDSTVVAGGSVLFLPSQVVLISSKAKMKPDSDGCCTDETDKTIGNVMTAVVYKGRLAKERSTAKFAIHYKHGFLKYYGLIEYALSGGYIEEGKEGRSTVYKSNTNPELFMKKKTMYLPENYPFWEHLLKDTDLGEYLNNHFKYGSAIED